MYIMLICFIILLFITDTSTDIYPLSLHDALPICEHHAGSRPEGIHRRLREVHLLRKTARPVRQAFLRHTELLIEAGDRKSTRLNSSHRCISYAVFCLKKKITKFIPLDTLFTTSYY